MLAGMKSVLSLHVITMRCTATLMAVQKQDVLTRGLKLDFSDQRKAREVIILWEFPKKKKKQRHKFEIAVCLFL